MMEVGYVAAMVLKSYKKNMQPKIQEEKLEPMNVKALENYAQHYKMAEDNAYFEASAINDTKAVKKAAI